MTLSYSLALPHLSAAYAAGSLTPTQVMRDIHAAIEARGDDHVWIHRLSIDEILAQVEASERRSASGSTLPLFCIPFAIKDNIDLAGHPTTAACPAYRYIAQSTAHAVQRLIDAGAILVGKTNLDQFATGLVGTRSPYGACANAFDPNYISGGSSSGSAIAVAAGLVSFALGTDTAGSGRVPAAFNNLVGLKPTRGLVSAAGIVPACRTLDCVSVFALTCSDARVVFECARGWDAQDAYSRRDAGGAAVAAYVGKGFRFGIPQAAQQEFFGDAEAAAQFRRAIGILRGLGGTPVEIDFAPFAETAGLLYQGPWVAERLAAIKDFFAANAEEMYPVTRQIIGGAQKFSAVDAFEAGYRLQHLQNRCAGVWEQIDVLAVPTTGTIYTHEEIAEEPVAHNTRLGYYTNFVNLLDLAAVAVPGGFRDDGLPAGITLIAPACTESSLLALGGQFHGAAGVPLGATGYAMPPESSAPGAPAEHSVTLAVVGAHLSGLPLNHELTSRGARLVATTATAKSYRLYALGGTQPAKPGLVCTGNASGAEIEVELWSLPVAAFGSFVASVPPPLGIGTIALRDGSQVQGFVCESYAVAQAQDISSYGGWRTYLARRE